MKSRDLKERDKQFAVFERGILLARAEGNFYRYTSSPRLLQYWVREGPQAGWQSAISVPFPLECLEEAVREPLDWTGQLLFPFALPVAEGFYPAYVSYFREFDPEAVRLVSGFGPHRSEVFRLLVYSSSFVDLCQTNPCLLGLLALRGRKEPLSALERLARKPQKEVLKRWFGIDRGWKIASRLRPGDFSWRNFQRLRQALDDRAGFKLLAHLNRGFGASVLKLVSDPACLSHITPSLIAEIAEKGSCERDVHSLLTEIREIHSLLRPKEVFNKKFRSVDELRILHRQMLEAKRRREKRLPDQAYPPAPFRGMTLYHGHDKLRLEPLTTRHQVMDVGEALGNCLRDPLDYLDYEFAVLEGRAYFCEVVGRQAHVVLIRRSRHKWEVSEVGGATNHGVSSKVRRILKHSFVFSAWKE